MTTQKEISKEMADTLLKQYPVRYYVLGYVFNETGEKEYVSVACVSMEQVERNRSKMINSRLFELKEVL